MGKTSQNRSRLPLEALQLGNGKSLRTKGVLRSWQKTFHEAGIQIRHVHSVAVDRWQELGSSRGQGDLGFRNALYDYLGAVMSQERPVTRQSTATICWSKARVRTWLLHRPAQKLLAMVGTCLPATSPGFGSWDGLTT